MATRHRKVSRYYRRWPKGAAVAARTCTHSARRGIAASFADYSDQAAQPEIRFQLNGRDAVLMRFGLKAEIVIALLTKENGRWRITFRSADYPLLC